MTCERRFSDLTQRIAGDDAPSGQNEIGDTMPRELHELLLF